MNRIFVRCLPAAILGALALASCSADPARGYSFAPTIAPDARTVAVPIFDNQTFQKGVEIELTEALVKEIQRTTHLGVTGAGEADTRLTGVVRRYELLRVTRDSTTGLIDEAAVRVVVDFDWKDNRTGKTLASRREFTVVDSFVPARGTGELLETGQHAAVQQIARGLVGEMRSAW